MRSNRAFCQAAGHYACDLFIGSTLQIDLQGNSSTATKGRIAGFGGAPNMGADARGRRHESAAWLKAGEQARQERATMPRGRKLVVQMVETFREHMQPAFVERLDAWDLAETMGLANPPVMIYGDDVTHVLTEEGIANLLLCRNAEEREQAIRGVAGYTAVGLARDRRMVERPARTRGDSPAGRPRHSQARGDARSAGRALGQGSRALVGRTLRPAEAVPQLVSLGGRNGATAIRVCRAQGDQDRKAPCAGRGGGLRESRGDDRAGCAERPHASRGQHGRARLRRAPGRRCWAISMSVIRLSDVLISINDVGATPAVVSLRLDQAVEAFEGEPA